MLSNIRVLDVGGWGVGPIACGVLGAMGADVIRFEPPKLDGLYYVGTLQGGVGTGYICAHPNARNIIIDLKSDEGRKLGFELVKTADILIENHTPQKMYDLGFGYEEVSKVNPRIIYCSSSGYGREGPQANDPSNDPLAQISTGFTSIQGAPGSKGELFRYITHIDWTTSLIIVEGVLLALISREVTGKGQKVDTSQFEASLAMQSTRIAEYFATGVSPQPMGSANPNIVPSQAFKTYDEEYVNVSIPREEHWVNLCKAIGLNELVNDPRFVTNAERVKNREQLIPILEGKFSQECAKWWLILLRRNGVPCGPYYKVDDIIRDPHMQENKMFVELDTPWGKSMYSNFPVEFSKLPKPINTRATVKPDANRKEILNEIGYKSN